MAQKPTSTLQGVTKGNDMGGVVSSVTDAVGGVVDTVKDVAGSDLGKAALLAGGAYYGIPALSEGWGAAAPELLGEASGAWLTSPTAAGATGLLSGLSTGQMLGLGAGALALGGGLGGSQPSSSTSSTAIDPQMKAAYLRNLEEARATAAGLGQKQFADFSGSYGTAEQQLRNIGLGGVGQTGTAEASRLTRELSGYTPQIGAQYMSAYQNPYEGQVVQAALGDVELARQRAGLSDRAAATAAKAFGGSRQGVAEALTNEAALRNASSTAANLRSAGFNTAAQLGQSDANRMLQGANLRLSAAGQIGNLAAQQQNLGIAGSQAVMQSEAQRQALEQAKLDAARNLSLERLGISQSALGLQPANLGGTTTTPIYKNQSASALGGALSGGMLGNMIGGAGGAGYGALAGGLLGLL
jgi:hypothetical protein